MKVEDILLMLKDGTIDNYLEIHHTGESITVKKLADVNFPSGVIVAADPLVLFDKEPFAKSVESGKYPVFLYIHNLEDDKRVSAAEIRFSDRIPVRFEMSLCGEQKLEDLKEPDDIFGYGVDTGTGSFMDKKTADALEIVYENKKGIPSEIDRELDKTYVYTYSTAVYTIPDTDMNVAIFSTGYGDGCYASYWGYDSDGEICCLISEFQTIDLDEEYTDSADIETQTI